MAFSERLHPRAGDGKFAHGGTGKAADMKVTSRRRNGAAVTEAAAAPPRAPGRPGYNAGPKDATGEELQAAKTAGKRVTMHVYDTATDTWKPDNRDLTVDTATTLALNAIHHHGMAGKVRLTVQNSQDSDQRARRAR